LGLDVAGRADTAAILGKLIADGLRVLLIARADALPEWVTHVLELDRLSVRWQGRKEDYRLPIADCRLEAYEAPSVDLQRGGPIIELRNVNVAYGSRAVLQDVTWTVRAGERWAVLGPNG